MKKLRWILVSVVLAIIILPAISIASVPLKLEKTKTFQSQAEIPETLLPALIAAMEADMPKAYHAKETDKKNFIAKNEEQKLDFGFSNEGIEISHNAEESWKMRLDGFGFNDKVSAIKKVTPKAKGARVEYQRDGLTEWYINSPYGMEQGFTVTAPKEKTADKLTLSFTLDGKGEVIQKGNGLTFTSKGKPSINYSGLHAYDANDKTLLSKLSLNGKIVSIEVDVTNAAYPIIVDPLFTQEAKLIASDGAVDDSFGLSGAISGNTVVIGAVGNDENGIDSGSAYVFVRSGTVWSEQQKLLALDGTTYDQFGYSVAISNDTIVIGAYGDDENGRVTGSAYVFVRSGTIWTQQQKLLASDAAREDYFGTTVAISGDTAVIGADGNNDDGLRSGSAYVFVRSGAVWTQQQKLLASDAAARDKFGHSVAISGETVLIGATEASDNGLNSGSAYVFVRNGTFWTQQQKILASDGAAEDHFGHAVAISGDTAVIGATWRYVSSASTGSAYVYVRNGGVWTQQQKLLASDGAMYDMFGFSVAIYGDTAIIGALGDSYNGTDTGSAYVFTRIGPVWTEQHKLIASDNVAGDKFGRFVSLTSDTIAIGAYEDDDNGTNSGSAYIYKRSPFIEPVPDIKANGLDGPITLPSGYTLSLTVALLAGDSLGQDADWWVLAVAPFGIYRYNVGTDSWMLGSSVTYQGPLFDLASREVLNISGLPVGTYSFSFEIDTLMNGVKDTPIYSDSVVVTVAP